MDEGRSVIVRRTGVVVRGQRGAVILFGGVGSGDDDRSPFHRDAEGAAIDAAAPSQVAVGRNEKRGVSDGEFRIAIHSVIFIIIPVFFMFYRASERVQSDAGQTRYGKVGVLMIYPHFPDGIAVDDVLIENGDLSDFRQRTNVDGDRIVGGVATGVGHGPELLVVSHPIVRIALSYSIPPRMMKIKAGSVHRALDTETLLQFRAVVVQIRNRYFGCDTGDGVSKVAVGVNAQGRVMGDDLEGRPYRVLDELGVIEGRIVAVEVGYGVGYHHGVGAVVAGLEGLRLAHQADVVAGTFVAEAEEGHYFVEVIDDVDAVAEALGRIGP